MNTQEAIDTVKRAKMVSPDNLHIKIYHELADEISAITDNFEKPEKLSDHKFDMADILKTEGISVDDYKQEFGSTKRSEIDVTLKLAENLNKIMQAKARAKAKLKLKQKAA